MTNMDNITLSENISSTVSDAEAWRDFSQQHLYIILPVTLIYSIIFLTGVLGNVITCIVISNHRSMHTATNYYLFSLAISDLVLLITGLPQEMYNTWHTWEAPFPFSETVCILQGFAAETSANATVLTITAFTVERYMAICHPFLSHTMSKLSRAIKFILAIWVISMCMAVPQTWDLGFTNGDYCTLKLGAYKHVFLISSVLVFAFPMVIITVLYILIGLQLRKSKVVTRGTVAGSSVRLKSSTFKRRAQQTIITTVDHQQPSPQAMKRLQSQPNMIPAYQFPINGGDAVSGNNGDVMELNNTHKNPTNGTVDEEGRKNFSTRSHNYASRHVVNMLVAVVVAFFICWAPQHSQRLYSTYAGENNDKQVFIIIYYTMNYTSGILYYLSTCINPFLYSIMSYKFREAFKETIVFSFHRRSPPSGRQASAEPILKGQSCGMTNRLADACCTGQKIPTRLPLSTFMGAVKPLPENFLPRHVEADGMWSDGKEIFALNHPTHAMSTNTMDYPQTKSLTHSNLLTRSDENLPRFVHEATEEGMYTSGHHHMGHLSQAVGMQQSIFHTVQEKAQQFVSRHVYIDFSGRRSNRSPYDSPEMSNSSKQLEENLQKILEDVVLHPTKHAKPKRRVTDFIRINGGKSGICCLSSSGTSKGSSDNGEHDAEKKCMGKSKSLPTFSHLNVAATGGESSQQNFYHHPPDVYA
ncbi:dopamine receptor 2-like [Lutzomyia longipalpis]|uniref:dopamine receptor 2-like n=1 Tax=Lutzomyia longipalpis TaxID=7200 RepID=UPI00248361AE|nr:dopamine receptor 2-like [Lutzomyia longipalpis]